MIRLAVLADAAEYPDYGRIPVVMQQVLYSENIVLSRDAVSICRSHIFALYDTFVLSSDVTYRPPAGCLVCHDHERLINRFHDSADELLVLGDTATLKIFLPHASSLDMADTNMKLTCNSAFDSWNRDSFSITSGQAQEGVRILHYKRKACLTG